ncbi:MAG: hypothetical protein COC01_00295 [Bacteroidetes bacterium]|nr:MAG: hypothetical protein COC01_00295 [Bacteroidota bacterium]
MKKTKIILFLAFTIAVIAFGIYSLKSERYKDTIRPAVKKVVMSVYNAFRDSDVTPESIHIKIKEKHFKKIKKIRDQALDDGYFIRDKDKYFPAKISLNDTIYDVKLRLKGDLTDHFDTDKWSYRIKVLDGKKILNMTTFSIQHPYTRNFIWEWVFHQAMKREGIIALDYKFINVSINNSDYGIFAMEEHFNDHMLAKNGREPAPILKFDEELNNQEYVKNKKLGIKNASNIDHYISSNIEIYGTGKTLDDSVKLGLQAKGLELLENFRTRKLKTSEVFNVQKLAKLFAIADLLSANHSLSWVNQRYYFDSKTNYLEPVAYDAGVYFPDTKNSGILHFNKGLQDSTKLYDELITNMSSDTIFYNQYLKELQRVSNGEYVQTILNGISNDIKRNLSILNTEFPRVRFDENLLYQRQKQIRSILSPTNCVIAYLDKNNELKLGNVQMLPVKVLEIIQNDSLLVKINRIIPGILTNKPIHYTYLKPQWNSFQDVHRKKLAVKYCIIGMGDIKYEKVKFIDSSFN